MPSIPDSKSRASGWFATLKRRWFWLRLRLDPAVKIDRFPDPGRERET